MQKSTKGALAAAAAGTLLLGGAGSLAFWTSAQTVDGTSITSGHLKLTTPDCGAGWTIDTTDDPYVAQKLVPGDTLTKVCTFDVQAAGDHLTADFDVTGGAITDANGLLSEIDITADFEVEGAPVGTITDGVGSVADVAVVDGDEVTVTLKVTWPYGVEDNDSNVLNGLSATLNAITVTATQSHNA